MQSYESRPMQWLYNAMIIPLLDSGIGCWEITFFENIDWEEVREKYENIDSAITLEEMDSRIAGMSVAQYDMLFEDYDTVAAYVQGDCVLTEIDNILCEVFEGSLHEIFVKPVVGGNIQ